MARAVHGGMSRSLRRSLLLVSAGVFAIITTNGAARADQGLAAAGPAQPICRVTLGEDGTGAIKLPSNAPAILVTDASQYGARATVTADLVTGTARTPLGATKTDANGLTILEIPSGTAAGAHTVELDADCGSSAQPQPEANLQLVLDAATVAFPSSVGALSVTPSSKKNPQETIVLAPSEGMRAFLPAAVLELTVGTHPPQRVSTGSLSSNSFVAQVGDVCVENGALHREVRVVKVSMTAKIAGVAQLPTAATVDVNVDCGAIEWTSGTAGGTSTTPGDTTKTTPGGSTTTQTGGCAAAPMAPGSTPAGAAFAAIALGAVVVLVRRRRA